MKAMAREAKIRGMAEGLRSPRGGDRHRQASGEDAESIRLNPTEVSRETRWETPPDRTRSLGCRHLSGRGPTGGGQLVDSPGGKAHVGLVPRLVFEDALVQFEGPVAVM